MRYNHARLVVSDIQRLDLTSVYYFDLRAPSRRALEGIPYRVGRVAEPSQQPA